MNDKLLASLGLTSNEAGLYQAVLKAKKITPSGLAKAVGIKRTTAYSIAHSLAEKGLILEDTTLRPKVFLPASVEELEAAIELEKKRSGLRQEALRKLGEVVSQATAEDSYPVPRITFVEESKILSHLQKRSSAWNESMSLTHETTFWGFQDPSFLQYFDEWIEWYWKRSPETFDVKLLTNLSSDERVAAKKYPRRETKYWGEATNFISTTWVLGDYLVMINTRQKPFYLVEIQSALLAHDQREVFRNIWGLI